MQETLTMVLSQAFDLHVLLAVAFGTFIGAAIGALPGLTATLGIALLVPLTFSFQPLVGLAMLLGIYGGGIYGGSITAILIRIPGTPASAATTLDGYPMTLKGRAGHALGISATVSFFGGIISVIFLATMAPQISKFTLKFGPPELCVAALFGLSMSALVSGENMIKGFVSVLLGLILSFSGIDPIVGCPRFTFGTVDLLSGVPFIPALIGLFAIPEVLTNMTSISSSPKIDQKLDKIHMSFKEIKRHGWNIFRSSIIGVFVGAVPGAGGDIGGWVAYGVAKKTSRHPESFGQGSEAGVVAPEAANNASTGGAMTTMLTLGIPGDAPTAVIIGALMVYGLRPGPMLFTSHLDLVYSIFVIMALANFCLLFYRFIGAKHLARIISVPKFILLPVIIVLCVVGSYAIQNNLFDIRLMLVLGLGWYLMHLCGFPAAPMVLGLILGPMVESNFRRSLIMSEGSVSIFFTRAYSLVPIIVLALVLLSPIVIKWIKRARKARANK